MAQNLRTTEQEAVRASASGLARLRTWVLGAWRDAWRGERCTHTGGRTMGAKVYGVRFECPGKSPSEPLHGAEVRLQNSPGHAPRSVYVLGPPSRRPGGSRNPPESPVLTAQPPRYSSPAAPRDMSRGHQRERRFKRPRRYRRASARSRRLPTRRTSVRATRVW